MRTLNFGIVRKFVMGHGGVRTKSGDLQVANIAALPIVGFVLQVLDEIFLVLPVTPSCFLPQNRRPSVAAPRTRRFSSAHPWIPAEIF